MLEVQGIKVKHKSNGMVKLWKLEEYQVEVRQQRFAHGISNKINHFEIWISNNQVGVKNKMLNVAPGWGCICK